MAVGAWGLIPRVEGKGGATALRMSKQTGMDEVVRLVKEALESGTLKFDGVM